MNDASVELKSMFRNDGYAKDVLNNRARIYEVLGPLVQHEKSISVEQN